MDREQRYREELAQSQSARNSPFVPPIITINRPPSDLRRSAPPMERTGPFGEFARLSETPPPRASRRRVDRFEDRFGDLGRPGKSSRPAKRSHGWRACVVQG
jgi:hypothetical protein